MISRTDYDLENVPNVIAACVTLHNLCEILGDHRREEWLQQILHSHHAFVDPPSLLQCKHVLQPMLFVMR